jgi:hypothetical protein
MTYRGHVRKGVIVLDSPAELPEGAEVEVHASEPVAAASSSESTWADVFREVIGQAEGLPADSSVNHDHYLYGAAKK